LGAFWGLFYTIILGVRNYSKTKEKWKIVVGKKKWLRIAVLGIALGLIIAGIILNELMLPFFLLALGVYVTYHLILLIKAVELSSMHKRITPDKLTEGDWLLEEVCIDGKRIAGPSKTGLQKKELDEIRERCSHRQICVKYGVPFTPAFLLAFIATLAVGNVILKIAISL